MTNDYGIEIQSEPLFAQIPLEIYEAEKKELNDLREKVKELEAKNKRLDEHESELEEDLNVSYSINFELKKRIKELEASQPKWISVKDWLPEENYRVLTYSTSMGVLQNWLTDGNWVYNTCMVDYWMPLPEAPKSED